ncbi:hypothetical protein AB1Y20_004383 [Prymnesium parvum]|uniref:ADP-ribosyl cyclase/cyclic ADP-ribose hydrolase n=1 Tax=Prymnesium parvum TaxID=97485 RepID=A0AB34IW66_PRYPA
MARGLETAPPRRARRYAVLAHTPWWRSLQGSHGWQPVRTGAPRRAPPPWRRCAPPCACGALSSALSALLLLVLLALAVGALALGTPAGAPTSDALRRSFGALVAAAGGTARLSPPAPPRPLARGNASRPHVAALLSLSSPPALPPPPPPPPSPPGSAPAGPSRPPPHPPPHPPPPPAPPPPPSPPSRPSRPPSPLQPPRPLRGPLSSERCDALLRDDRHLFRRMWARHGWAKMRSGEPPCWEVDRENLQRTIGADAFFDAVRTGRYCYSNWYEGNPGDLGRQERVPSFEAAAPALLGFDGDIVDFCAGALRHESDEDENHAYTCVKANFNILNLVGKQIPYNICRNLEWQACAASGKLPGQRGARIVFATPPNALVLDSGPHPLGACGGWMPPANRRSDRTGWANDDIFFLEVCLFNQICSNGPELFRLSAGEEFQCRFDPSKVTELQSILARPAPPALLLQSACDSADEDRD